MPLNLRSTHTLVELELSPAAYAEIAQKLLEAGYDHVFIEDGLIDMNGIALRGAPGSEPT